MVTSVNVIVRLTSQLSVPVAVPVLAGNVLAEHKMVMLAGQEMLGIVVSLIVIV